MARQRHIFVWFAAGAVLLGCETGPEVRHHIPGLEQFTSGSTNRILGTALPKDFRTLFVFPVYDDSGSETLGPLLYDKLLWFFREDGRLIPVSEMDEAHGVLALRIVRFDRQAQTYDAKGFPDTVLLSLQTRFLVRDLEHGKDLFQREMEERVSFNLTTEPVGSEQAVMDSLLDRVSSNVFRATVDGFY